MTLEWALLLALGAAVLVPAALLLGFAGCYSPNIPMRAPIILFARGDTLTSVEIAWLHPGPYISWIIEVTKAGDAPFEVPADATPFLVPNLETGAPYTFRVKTIAAELGESAYSDPVTGSTVSPAFDFPFTPPNAGDAPGAEGLCLITRIEAARVVKSGSRIAVTLVGPSTGTTSIDRIYVSQPAAAGDPYDAGGDLTAVFDIDMGVPPLVLQAGETRTLPFVDYALDQAQPLLVAFDITGSPPAAPSTVRTLTVLPQDAGSFTRRVVEAAVADRTTGYSADGRIFLITRIDA